MADEDLGCNLSQQYSSFLKDATRKSLFDGRLWYGGMGPSCVPLQHIPPPPQHPTVHEAAWATLGTELHSVRPIKSNLSRGLGNHLALPYSTNEETEAERGSEFTTLGFQTSALHSEFPLTTFGMCGNSRG